MKHPCLFSLPALTALFLSTGCCRHFTAVAPDGFATYRSCTTFKAAHYNRIVYRVRQIRNKPYAPFDFWKEALPRRMKDAGYRIIGEKTLTLNDQNILLLDMAAPLGSVDYSYMLMMTVKKKRILIAEAAGAVEEVRKSRGAIMDAFKRVTFK